MTEKTVLTKGDTPVSHALFTLEQIKAYIAKVRITSHISEVLNIEQFDRPINNQIYVFLWYIKI